MKVRVRLGKNVGGSGYGVQKRYGDAFRKEFQEKRLEKEKKERIKELGLEEDISIGEDLWRINIESKVPYKEWWDSEIDEDSITSYILHPVTNWKEDKEIAKVMLTKEERRKLRRGRRREKAERIRDLEKLGIIKNEIPDVDLKFGGTGLEMAIEEERRIKRAKHDEMNLQRKEEARGRKEEKREEKLDRDMEKGIYRCVVSVGKGKLNDGKNRYKVNVNGREMGIKGVCVSIRESEGGDGSGVVIFEGGRVSVDKYKKLLVERSEIGEVIWVGEVGKCVFNKWSYYEFNEMVELIEFLNSKGGKVWIYQSNFNNKINK